MKLYGACTECAMDLGGGPFSSTADFAWVDLGDLREEGVARGKCPRGHEVNVIIQASRHVILFDSACLALLDGYYREAIGSFAVALERFYEFALRVICAHRGLGHEIVEEAWKLLGTSEREFGAFTFVYALLTGKPLPKWKLADERNAATHKGRLPTQEGAFAFGDACYQRILAVTNELRTTAEGALNGEISRQMAERHAHLGPLQKLMTIGPGTSPVDPEFVRPTIEPFADVLNRFALFPRWVHPADRISIGAIARDAELSLNDVFTVVTDGTLKRHLINAIEESRMTVAKPEEKPNGS
jgi:hypothetical protein